MPHPFDPEDFPIDDEFEFYPTQTFYLKGAIHFKKTAQIFDLTGKVKRSFKNFAPSFLDAVSKAAEKEEKPAYEVSSCGEMMRTIKTMTDANGEKVCDLNITFISFDSSTIKFPPESKHCRHTIEICPVGDGQKSGDGKDKQHEAFVRHSIPYFWDMTTGAVGVLYKTYNQKRIEVAKVAAYGFAKDAVLVIDGDEVDAVVAISTCIILLNGRDAMDA